MKKFWQAALLFMFLEALGMLGVWASVYLFTHGRWISGGVFAFVGLGWMGLIAFVFNEYSIFAMARAVDDCYECWDDIKEGVV